jgi:phage FluMu protein Com
MMFDDTVRKVSGCGQRHGHHATDVSSNAERRCDHCGKLLGKAKGGQMHILRKPFEPFASFPVTARCPGCTRLNLRNSG